MPISRLFSLLKKFCCVYIKGRFGNVVLVFFGIRVDEKVLWKYMLYCLNNENCYLNTPTKHPHIFSTRLELIMGEGIFFWGGGGGGCISFIQIIFISQQKGKLFFFLSWLDLYTLVYNFEFTLQRQEEIVVI